MAKKESTEGAGFTAPPVVNEGNATTPVSMGTVTQNTVTKSAKKSGDKVVRNIKVVAIDKGWFDCKRIDIGKKFMVSEAEYSERWMQKI